MENPAQFRVEINRQGYRLSGIVRFSDLSDWLAILVYSNLNAKRPWRLARAVWYVLRFWLRGPDLN